MGARKGLKMDEVVQYVGPEHLKQEAGGESLAALCLSGSIMYLGGKQRTLGYSVHLRKGSWLQMLCIHMMSQAPGTSGYIIMNFTCRHLQDHWEV